MKSRSRKTRRKRHSCALCKPHKMGGSAKDSNKYQAAEKNAQADARDYDPDELVSIHATIAADEAMAS